MPKKGPVLIAVNHPTAFTDPVLICANFWRPIYSILKGNMFSSPLVKLALYGVKCIPIFRTRDGAGFSALRQNVDMMNIVNNHFERGKIVQIMVEGARKHEKRLRPLQKGMARMAFNYYKKSGKDDLVIIPAPITYSDAGQFRGNCSALLTPPIYLKDYIELFEEDNRKALNKLTKDVRNQMISNMVHIEREEDDEVVDKLILINANRRPYKAFAFKQTDETPLREQISIAEKINAMEVSAKNSLKNKVTDYFQQLAKHKIKDVALARHKHGSVWGLVLFLLGWIPAKIGYLFNAWPLLLGKYIADTKTDNYESHASIQFAVGMIAYFFYWFLWILAAFIVGNLYLWAWVILMPILGWFYLIHKELSERYFLIRRYQGLEKPEQEKLQRMRMELSI